MKDMKDGTYESYDYGTIENSIGGPCVCLVGRGQLHLD